MATQCVTNLSHLKRRTLTEIEILSTGYSVWKTINTVKRLGLTYLSKRRLLQIARTIRSIQASDIPGDFIEAGCALGGSSVLIATMKNKKESYKYMTFLGKYLLLVSMMVRTPEIDIKLLWKEMRKD